MDGRQYSPAPHTGVRDNGGDAPWAGNTQKVQGTGCGRGRVRAASRAGPLLCRRVGVDSDGRNGPKGFCSAAQDPVGGANRSSDWFTPAVGFEVLKGG